MKATPKVFSDIGYRELPFPDGRAFIKSAENTEIITVTNSGYCSFLLDGEPAEPSFDEVLACAQIIQEM